MTSPLEGRTALVTGASRGIGRAISLSLAGAGARVAVVGRDRQRLTTVCHEISDLGSTALELAGDITQSGVADDLVRKSLEHWGQLDILVNCAGVVSSSDILNLSETEWDRVMDTNIRALFLVTRAVGRHMVERKSGKIINVASNFAFKGVANHSVYSASKAAIVAFTRCAAIEWAPHNVQVNAIAPGYIATDLNADVRGDDEVAARITRTIPARRIGTPEELGPWVVMLASAASDYVTGETIVIDGGLSAR